MYQVDVNKEYQKAKSNFLRYSLLFSLIFSLVLVTDVLLILFAGEDYQINLLITIIISILFLWFAIFFFTNIYQDINNRYRYFKGYDSGIKPTDEDIKGDGKATVYLNLNWRSGTTVYKMRYALSNVANAWKHYEIGFSLFKDVNGTYGCCG